MTGNNFYKQLNDELYLGSLDDIQHNVECLEYFRGFKRKYRFTALENLFDDTIELLVAGQKELLIRHKEDWDEDVDVMKIKHALQGMGMSRADALDIIEKVRVISYDLSSAETTFLDDIVRSTYKRLTVKQSEWLMAIYGRTL